MLNSSGLLSSCHVHQALSPVISYQPKPQPPAKPVANQSVSSFLRNLPSLQQQYFPGALLLALCFSIYIFHLLAKLIAVMEYIFTAMQPILVSLSWLMPLLSLGWWTTPVSLGCLMHLLDLVSQVLDWLMLGGLYLVCFCFLDLSCFVFTSACLMMLGFYGFGPQF